MRASVIPLQKVLCVSCTFGIDDGVGNLWSAFVCHSVNQDEYHVPGGIGHVRVQPRRQADPLPDDGAFLIYTAAVFRLGTGDDPENDLFRFLRVELSGPGQAADLRGDIVFEIPNFLIVG